MHEELTQSVNRRNQADPSAVAACGFLFVLLLRLHLVFTRHEKYIYGNTDRFSMGFGKDGRGAIVREQRSQSLGTLANNTALLIGTKIATLEDFRILRSEISVFVNALTDGEGPGLMFGLADGDLTASEIASAITTGGPVGPNDVVAGNIAERPVFVIGMIEDESNNGTVGVFHGEHAGGMIVYKPKWTFANGTSWNWFVFNNIGAAFTTGATIKLLVKNFGVWVR